MRFLFSVVLLTAACGLIGCSSSEPSNIMDNADQAAIDAYEAQVAKDNEALGNYEGAE